MSAALQGIRVLDLTRLLPGGYCTQLLADYGAEVIKVEDTGLGDYIRWAPPYHGGEEMQASGTRSALYLSLNRNKRSIRVDLKSEAGREALTKLVGETDVLVEGFRPGVMDRLGLGYEHLREINPGLVYCAITGYGQDGPYRDRAGHDQNYLALNGVLGLTGTPPADGSPGQPVLPGVQIADLAGGAMMAAFGILAALHERNASGLGQLVDVSMTDGARSMLAMEAARYFCAGEVQRRGDGQLGGGAICYLPYEAADGWVSCAALEPKFWAAFCSGVGREDLVEKQFERPGTEAWREVAAIFAARTRQEWSAFNHEHDCCIEPILELDEALESELASEREATVEWDQPGIGTVRQLGPPVKLDRTPGRVREPAPTLGEHTAEILAEAGYSEGDIEQLLESGAVAGAKEGPGNGDPGMRF